jgi:Na+-translocating ferredoxin:NAD+ oxidoreductase subunit G
MTTVPLRAPVPQRPRPPVASRGRATLVVTLAAGVWVAAMAGRAAAQVTREEALAAVYPGAAVRAERVFLTATQQKQVAAQAGSDAPTALVVRYIATRDGAVVGRAYVDTHTVRTKKESLLISLDDKGVPRRIDVTAFLEPAEYRASDPWLRQYSGKPLSEDLAINRAIRPIAGATLTARATNEAVRRVLAIDAVLQSGGFR